VLLLKILRIVAWLKLIPVDVSNYKNRYIHESEIVHANQAAYARSLETTYIVKTTDGLMLTEKLSRRFAFNNLDSVFPCHNLVYPYVRERP